MLQAMADNERTLRQTNAASTLYFTARTTNGRAEFYNHEVVVVGYEFNYGEEFERAVTHVVIEPAEVSQYIDRFNSLFHLGVQDARPEPAFLDSSRSPEGPLMEAWQAWHRVGRPYEN
jgi:hypothetical protein